MSSDRPGKTIVLFADGTGNTFKTQESNVWRIYRALDLRDAAQVAYYIPGVGTSGFRPWAMLDGATGLGVPSNIRKLYEFLCWNYDPGDRIYMFGFSRGAFTIRSLIGMIDSEGILSTRGRRGIASSAEMRRNVMSAWRAYRAGRARTVRREAPTIKVVRALRDALLAVRRVVGRRERYARVAARAHRRPDIEFAGLFDTVEAYGVPIEEMRDAIDWAVWPIRFSDRRISANVKRVRHALSLDDERQTFHPVRIDLRDEGGWETSRIREVWFAGMHSDVGGGYPDDALAYVPLTWMVGELGDELDFVPGSLDYARDEATPLAAIHDSRSGLGIFYRYAPRIVETGAAEGGAATIHHSVVEKMVGGCERYAPHGLPANAYVLMPDGSRPAIKGFARSDAEAGRERVQRSPEQAEAQARAAEAVRALSRPVDAFVEAMRDGIWLRRKAYFLLLTTLLVFASLPWTAAPLAALTGLGSGSELVGGLVKPVNDALVAWMQDIAVSTAAVTPGYAKPWADAAATQPLVVLIVVVLAGLLVRANAVLRDKINDDGRCAWFGSEPDEAPERRAAPRGPDPHRGALYGLARRLRSRSARRPRRGPVYWAGFCLTLLVLAGGLFLYLDRVWLSYRIGLGEICRLDPRQEPRTAVLAEFQRAEGYRTSNPCWDTGFFVEKGRTYLIRIGMTEPYLDRARLVGLTGFSATGWRHLLASPLKRWWHAAYFAPIVRIGPAGMTEIPLASLDGEQPLTLGPDAIVAPEPGAGVCRATSPPVELVERRQEQLQIPRTFTARFTAPEAGELFLFVNDAILGSDWLARLLFLDGSDCFYRNNGGAAVVDLALSPGPAGALRDVVTPR